MMGDLNMTVSNVAVESITEGHWVFSKVNGSGEQLLELCAENGVEREYLV